MKSRKAYADYRQLSPAYSRFGSSRQHDRFTKLLGFSVLLLVTVITQPLWGQGYWTGWISEEQDTVQARPGYYLAGYRCAGRYCDDRKLYFRTHPDFDRDPGGSIHRNFLAFVSDETGVAVAPQGYLISGLKCWNDYCDHVALEIAQNRRANLLVDRSRWEWTPWISEESHKNYYVAREGWFIIGYVCRGSYCDDRKFMIAPLLPGQNARCDK